MALTGVVADTPPPQCCVHAGGGTCAGWHGGATRIGSANAVNGVATLTSAHSKAGTRHRGEIRQRRRGLSERRGAGFRHRVVLVARPAADADGADDFAVALQRNAAGEDHDASVVGGVNAEELAARL